MAVLQILIISIHAPRAGRDRQFVAKNKRALNFNPRAPCGARLLRRTGFLFLPPFQSTRPVRGATRRYVDLLKGCFISIHAPRAGRDPHLCGGNHAVFISIHAPRAGRDLFLFMLLSSLSISIHAPRAGRDRRRMPPCPLRRDFNPRAPCGARPMALAPLETSFLFQSTRPVRGATYAEMLEAGVADISIHAPRAGRDSKSIQITLHTFATKGNS